MSEPDEKSKENVDPAPRGRHSTLRSEDMDELASAIKEKKAASSKGEKQKTSVDIDSTQKAIDGKEVEALVSSVPDRKKKTPEPLRPAQIVLGLVIAAAAIELGAHLVQVKRALTEKDFAEAKAVAGAMLKPTDGLVFSPSWTEPLGRQSFRELATAERMAYASVDRFARIVEVSARGKRLEASSTWKTLDEKSAGPLVVRTLENPNYRPVVTDLVDRMNRENAAVFLKDDPCTWGQGPAQTGGLGFGTAIPRLRYQCSQSVGGVSIVADMDYRPHRCIHAPPPGGSPLRIVFRGVKMGAALSGHHGLYVEAERHRSGAPVRLAFSVGSERIGQVVHSDGESWKPFEFSTASMAGKEVDLQAEIQTENGERRQYCFEAVTL